MQELPAVFREAREAIEHIDQTLRLADSNLENLQAFTEPLGQKSDQMFQRLDRSAEKLDRILDAMVDFSEALNTDEGTLGRLLHDPTLYDNVNSAAENVEQLTRDLRPILDDVRIFTDKIARDPGRLGVRGVFQQNNGVK
jgi:phospholipid/cholesterol/gamma-HCH transport system substrate-binding protein